MNTFVKGDAVVVLDSAETWQGSMGFVKEGCEVTGNGHDVVLVRFIVAEAIHDRYMPAKSLAVLARCSKCGEHWPCVPVLNPGAYSPLELARHQREGGAR